MIEDKRIVITGGGGFIGTTLAEKLCARNKVVLYDLNFENNSYSFSNLKNNPNIELITGDILNLNQLDIAISNANVVIHTAARVGVQRVIDDALNTLEINYVGASNVLKACSNSPVCERVIVFSTSEIFGASAFNVAENGDSLLSPAEDIRWCYSISKLASEHLARSYHRQKGVPVVVVRPFNVFGPKRVGDHVVLRFIIKALKNEDLEVYGDGKQIRAWCYVDDFCDAVIRCTGVESAVGESFNIGNSANAVTIHELAKKIIALSGSKSNIVLKEANFKDIDLRIPNTTKAKEILGYIPSVDLDVGLLRTIQWVRTNSSRVLGKDYLSGHSSAALATVKV